MKEEKDYYITYLRWYISDPDERYPKSMEDFLSTYELTMKDLSDFEARPTFYDDLEREIKNWGISKLPEILREAFKQAKGTGRASAINAFKSLLEDNKNKNNTVNIFAINPSPEQYQRILNRENKRLGDGNVIDITP